MNWPRLNFSKLKVLAVDDNAQAMEIVTQILLGFGVAQISRCMSAKEAKEVLPKVAFNLIIIDDEMPGQDGFELVSWIRREPQSINYTAPIVLASANPTAARILRARNSGANFTLAKPIVPGIFLDRIQWVARDPRQFVTSDNYRGPDRRFQSLPLPEGITERRADALRLMEAPERELSQDEISSLFG